MFIGGTYDNFLTAFCRHSIRLAANTQSFLSFITQNPAKTSASQRTYGTTTRKATDQKTRNAYYALARSSIQRLSRKGF